MPIRLAAADGAALVVATVHPSAVLRSPNPAARKRAEAEFMADIKAVARLLER